jgi:hypothetical protein
MNNIIEPAFQIPEKLIEVYKKMEISPLGILNNYALNQISNKLQKYELENKFFEKKYSCSFIEFKNKITAMKDKENFIWEDDLMDWEFAIENFELWQRTITEIKNQRLS